MTARLNYRKHQNHSATPETERKKLGEQYKVENDNLRLNVNRTKLAPQQSKTLKKAIQQLEPIQVRYILHLTQLCFLF